MHSTEIQYRYRVYYRHANNSLTLLGQTSAGSKYEACDKIHSNVLRVAGPNNIYRNQANYTARKMYVPRPAFIGRKYASHAKS